jgi:hypothetical protein
MPFDGTPVDAIECIKRLVYQARGEGRLICDNHRKFEKTTFSEERGGVVYVCALGAWEEVVHKHWHDSARHLSRTDPVRQYAIKLMWAHDELFAARKAGNQASIDRAEKTFNALLA